MLAALSLCDEACAALSTGICAALSTGRDCFSACVSIVPVPVVSIVLTLTLDDEHNHILQIAMMTQSSNEADDPATMGISGAVSAKSLFWLQSEGVLAAGVTPYPGLHMH